VTEVPPPSDDLVGHECDRCGRTYPGADYNNEPGFCVKPWAPEDTSCDRLYTMKLESDLAATKAKLAATEDVLTNLREAVINCVDEACDNGTETEEWNRTFVAMQDAKNASYAVLPRDYGDSDDAAFAKLAGSDGGAGAGNGASER
jgi:hypothetical protein